MVGAAPAAQSLQLVLPLKADLAGLRRTTLAITTPGSPRYAHYESIAQLAHRFGASPFARTRVVELPSPRRGQEREDRCHRAVRRRDDGRGSRRAAVQDPAGAVPLRSRRAVRAPRRRLPRRPGTCRPDCRAWSRGGRTRHQTAFLLAGDRAAFADRGAPSAHAASQPSSARLRTGTPLGCAAGGRLRRVHAQPVPDRLRIRPASPAGIEGQGERVALIEIDGFSYS